MVSNRVLTKFMEYRPEIFCYPRLKVTLPADFNDPFDSQLRLSENDTKKLSEKYNIPIEKVLYYAKRLQTVHILSLSRKHALDADSANMWGLYAKSGKGIAFEFDYNCVEEYNLFHLRQFYSQLNEKDLPNQITYIKEKLTKQILAQIKVICSAENRYSGANEIISNVAPIHLIPDYIACDEELTYFESTLSRLTIAEVKKQAHLLNKLLELKMIKSLGNTGEFLHSVVYDKQRDILSIFEDFITTLENNQSPLDLVSEFMVTKNQIWEHEEESRILVMDVCSNIINKSNFLLSELRTDSRRYVIVDEELERVRAELHFINFSEVIKVDPIELSHQSSGEDIGFIPKIYLPFPKKIYLGWDFDTESANGKEQLKHIKEYTRKYGIELCKLKKEIDYTSENDSTGEKRVAFMADEIKI
jgi:hypothetical protein